MFDPEPAYEQELDSDMIVEDVTDENIEAETSVEDGPSDDEQSPRPKGKPSLRVVK